MFRRSEYVANSYQRYVFFIKVLKQFEKQVSLKTFVLLRSKFVLVLMDFSKFDYKNEIARSVMGYVKCCCHLLKFCEYCIIEEFGGVGRSTVPQKIVRRQVCDLQPLRLRVPSAGLPGSGTVRQRARWNGYFGPGAPQTVKVAKVFKTF